MKTLFTGFACKACHGSGDLHLQYNGHSYPVCQACSGTGLRWKTAKAYKVDQDAILREMNEHNHGYTDHEGEIVL